MSKQARIRQTLHLHGFRTTLVFGVLWVEQKYAFEPERWVTAPDSLQACMFWLGY